MDDVYDISFLLQQEAFNQSVLKNDLVELDISIERQEKQFENEIETLNKLKHNKEVVSAKILQTINLLEIDVMKLEKLRDQLNQNDSFVKELPISVGNNNYLKF